jgi:hypothetical protein
MQKTSEKQVGSGSGSEIGYRLEVRDTGFIPSHPEQLSDGVVGPDWREHSPVESMNPAGVPYEHPRISEHYRHSLLGLEAALALAWTIIAQHRNHCLEVRIICYRAEHQYTLYRCGVDAPTGSESAVGGEDSQDGPEGP